jgi:hypothetical protein
VIKRLFLAREKKRWKKVFLFLSDMKFLFYGTTFSASALEHRVQITLGQRRQIGVMPKRTDREADYMCFSPLRRNTSELEGEEEYSRLVSRNLRDRRQN